MNETWIPNTSTNILPVTALQLIHFCVLTTQCRSNSRNNVHFTPSSNFRRKRKLPEHDTISTGLQGYEGQYTLAISCPVATGSMLAQQPWIFFPTPDRNSAADRRPSAICLFADLHPDPTPLLSVFSHAGYAVHALFPCSYIAGISDCWLSLQPPADACSPFAVFSTLKMEAKLSSETSVNAGSTQRHIPEDDILQN
jgi:hypothetical protein